MKLLPPMNRRVLSHLAASTGALVIAAGVAAVTVPPAGAAVTGHPGTVASATTQGRAVDAANITSLEARHQASVITCTMVYQGANGGLPHPSGHFPGSVNVRVRVTCDKPVTSILGYVVLFQISNKGKILRRTSAQKYDSTGRAAANGNAALGCKAGYYEGDSAALVTFPPGYTPSTGLLRDYTNVARISEC
jgi:hypothetical protein